jgi:predicted transcriptional regulator
MEPESLPVEVRRFLRERIGSYEELHLLMLLLEQRREWSKEELATQVRLSIESVSSAIATLVTRGLVAAAPGAGPEPKYRYAAGVQDAAVNELVRAYREQPIAVARLLAQGSIERIRAGALRAFADAFLFRKGK